MTVTMGNCHPQNGLVARHLHEYCPCPLFHQNGATSNLRLGTVCGFLVVNYVGAKVAKYECSM